MTLIKTQAKGLDEFSAGARWETFRAGYWSQFGPYRSELVADCRARADFYTTRFMEAQQ